MATKRKIYKESRVPMPTWPGLYLNEEGVEQPETKIQATHRLRKEGPKRHAAFNNRRLALKRRLMKAGEHFADAAKDEAWAITLKEFPPMPVEQWEDEVESQKEPEEPAPCWVAPKLDVDEALAMLPALEKSKIEEAFIWVADHRALSRKGPTGERYLIDADLAGCPSRWAWSLLMQAIDDPPSFRKEMMQRIKATKPGEAEDTGPTDSDADLDAILGRAMG
jgi:hypothetical protein